MIKPPYIKIMYDDGERYGYCTSCNWHSRRYLAGQLRLLKEAGMRHLKGHANRAEKELQASRTSVSGAPV